MNTTKGIDVSTWNSVTDYNVVANNIDFAIVKATQGHSVTSSYYLFTDSKFATHLNGFYNAGVDCGVYHYLTAATVDEAKKEAEYFCSIILPYKNKIKLWAAVDVEEKSYLPLGNKPLLTAIVTEFCQVVESKGFKSIVYTNPDFLTNYMTNITKYDLWLALWRDISNVPSFTTYPNMKAWQYSGSGSIKGVSGAVDMDLGFYTEDESEDEEMTYEQFKTYMTQYIAEQQKSSADEWALDSKQWVVTNSISDGTYPKRWITRQEVWTMLKRLYDKFIK